MNVQRLFAVDLGASGGKCFCGIFDNGSFSMSEIHRFAHEGVSFYVPEESGAIVERTYWNDISIYHNIISGLQAYRRDVSRQLDSVGIDTWGADGQIVDRDGFMLGKIYCYRDHRLDNMVEVVKSRVDAGRVYEITGNHFQPFNVSNQLHWFMTHRKDALRPGCVYLPIPAVFNFYLGGVKKVDSTWASVTQLMDAKQKNWSREILESLDIPENLMPEIVEPGEVIGEITQPLASSIGINQAKLIAVGSHDTASAFAAAPVDCTDEALIISSGTWALIGKLVPEPITTVAARQINASNEGGIGNTRFLMNCVGSWLVQELRRIWRIADGREMDWNELNKMTNAAPAFTAFVNPDDPSFYNPSDMSVAIADFCKKTGQTVPQDRGTFLRLVYESLALKHRFVNEQICAVSNTITKVVHIVGGGCKNITMNQFVANAMGLPVYAGPEEATAVGNLMVQAMGLGIIKSMKDALMIIKTAFPITEYKPSDIQTWNKAYERFCRILA